MADETSKLDYEAGQKLRHGDYEAAIDAVLAGSGDLQVAALLAIARELASIGYSLPVRFPGQNI